MILLKDNLDHVPSETPKAAIYHVTIHFHISLLFILPSELILTNPQQSAPTMTLSRLLDRYSNLFIKPFMIMIVSVIAALLTAVSYILHFETPLSLSKFKSLWFSRLWSLLGPISTKGGAIHVRPLVQQAHGVVLDVGYDTRPTIAIISNPRRVQPR